jgi:hypothetical protein
MVSKRVKAILILANSQKSAQKSPTVFNPQSKRHDSLVKQAVE